METETVVDLSAVPIRELNQSLHAPGVELEQPAWRILRPRGRHAIACGLDAEMSVDIEGHVGYYCTGMNQYATVTVHGNAGMGVAENMMSGRVNVHGDASQSASATGHGGLLVVESNAAARCGISMKGRWHRSINEPLRLRRDDPQPSLTETCSNANATSSRSAAWSSPTRMRSTPSTTKAKTPAEAPTAARSRTVNLKGRCERDHGMAASDCKRRRWSCCRIRPIRP